MSRWAGVLGFVKQEETEPGIWEEVVTEKKYTGDAIKSRTTLNSSSSINPQLNISNQIQVIADPYILTNIAYIAYVTFLGQKWYVNELSYEKPRITLSIGGLYGTQSNKSV